MKNLLKRFGAYAVIISCIWVMFGCKQKEKKEEFEYYIVDVESSNDKLYDRLVSTYYEEDAYKKEINNHRPYGYKYTYVSTLALKMELNKDNPDMLYHIVVFNWKQDEINTRDIVDQINAEKGMNLNMDDWFQFCDDEGFWHDIKYYYIFTVEEVNALAEAGLTCYYVGSGEGSEEEANWDTPEGLDIYCELYGDDYVQYREGMTVYME